MAPDTQYFLKYNEFQDKIQMIWKYFQFDHDFCDTTLVCDDKMLQAHKAVISSCSPILNDILKHHSNQSALIHLSGVNWKDLENLLIFMYQGQVNIDIDNLHSFLGLTADLQIKGFSVENVSELHKKDNLSQLPSIIRSRMKEYEDGQEKIFQEKNHQNIVYRNETNDITLVQNTPKDISEKNEARKSIQNKIVSLSQDKGFACDKCNKHYTWSHHLKRHIESSHAGVIYACNYCNHKANDKSNLSVHLKNVHKRENTNQNNNGPLLLKRNFDKLEHQENDDSKKTNKTLQQNVNKSKDLISSGSGEMEHQVKTDFTKSVPLNIEDNEFKDVLLLSNIQEDIEMNSNAKVLIANKIDTEKKLDAMVSNMEELNSEAINKHNSIVIYDEKFDYDKCSKDFKWNKNQKRHIHQSHDTLLSQVNLIHEDNVCLLDSSQLNTGNEKSSENSVKDMICSELLNESNTKTSLKKFTCDKCTKAFTKKHYLKRHIKLFHEGILYPCDLCENKYRQEVNLSNHISTIHEGVCYPCEYCDYKAGSKYTHKSHVLSIHKGSVRQCTQCDYKTSDKGHFKLHKMSAHIGVTHWNSCNYCSYKAKTNAILKTHIDAIHKGIRYPCNLCEYKATQMSALQRHKGRRHY